MKLLPKLSFFTFLLVLSTASMAIFVSVNTIKSIIDEPLAKLQRLNDKYLGRKRPSFKTSPAGLNVFLFDLTQLAVLERTF